MRFRRLMFGIIPDKFQNEAEEQEYVLKFRRLLEYLNKLREKDEFKPALDVKFVCKFDKTSGNENERFESTPGIAHNSMQRFYVQLRKGGRDPMEWIEIVVDSTFNTQWSYRIILNWLVASSGKVDTQVQLLQRRCVQFGLTLIPFPQITVSRNVFLNPFKAPVIYCVSCPKQAAVIDVALAQIDFVHDGVFYTDVKAILDVVDNGDIFKMAASGVAGRQYVHRTGTLFVRIITDKQGFALVVVLGNYRIMQSGNKEDIGLEQAYRTAFLELSQCMHSLGEVKRRDNII